MDELTAQVALQSTDAIPFADDSQTNNRTAKVTIASLATHLAGTNLSADSDGNLNVTGAGDITGITTTSGTSGLSGGCTSGTCSLAVAPIQLPQLTALDSNDYLIVGDNSDSNNPKRISVSLLGNGNGGVDVGTNGLVIDIAEVANFVATNDNIRSADTFLFRDSSASAVREVTHGLMVADLVTDEAGIGIKVANSRTTLQLNWSDSDLPTATSISDGDYVGFHDVSVTNDHFNRMRFDDFQEEILEDPDSASTGQVLIIGSGGDPEWAFPFEFPRVTRIARHDEASDVTIDARWPLRNGDDSAPSTAGDANSGDISH